MATAYKCAINGTLHEGERPRAIVIQCDENLKLQVTPLVRTGRQQFTASECCPEAEEKIRKALAGFVKFAPAAVEAKKK